MIEGQWRLEGDGVAGFARDTGSGRALWVELMANGECLGISLADLPEPEGCGFFIHLPAGALEDDAELSVRIANTDACLEQIHAEGQEMAAPAPLSGDIYVDRGLTITGWVLDPARTDHKLRVLAETDGKIVANTVAAARYYKLGIGDGHGFRLELPETLADGKPHVINLQDEKGRQVPGSPIRVRSLNKNLGEWLKSQKKIDKPLQDLLADMLENMEERLPGVLGEAKFPLWKKAFPVPQPAKRQKAAIAVQGDARLLKGQQGIEIAKGGEFVFFPGNAKSLHPFCLAHMVAALRQREAQLVYADGEDDTGQPLLKPIFDSEFFLAKDYLGPCLCRADLARQNDRFATVLNAAASGDIAHLPLLLSCGEKEDENRAETVNSWLRRNCPGASRENGQIVWPLAERPRVSIIIPTRDHGDMLAACLASLWRTDWPDFEIIIIDNGTVEENAINVLAQAEMRPNVCVLRRPGLFNYAALNNDAAARASGSLICFLNNDTEALHPGWLSELCALLLAAGDAAGCAGAKLLWPNRLVQHGGVIVGTHQLAAHVGNQWLEDEPGYMGRNQFAQQYSAVTAACMLTPKKLFLKAGGFDARRFPIAFNDVDYCLRLGRMGKKILWTPRSRLAHHESASRGADKKGSARARAEREMRFFRTLWGHYNDPFYNPNLPLCAGVEPFLGLAFPPGPREARAGIKGN